MSESGAEPMSDLVEGVLAGEQRALARSISRIEDRAPGYRDLVAAFHEHAGDAHVVGVTGPPGAGKSTLVDRLVAAIRESDRTVGVVAIDPASPFTGGAVLGDRIRMGTAADPGVFVRSMSARGALGGLATATTDAVTALDAFGTDVVIVETVGAGQNEIDVVRTADTVAVVIPPASGDDVQMLKAGILEIADCFVVNKADLDGADRTVTRLREMLRERSDRRPGGHGANVAAGEDPAAHHVEEGDTDDSSRTDTGDESAIPVDDDAVDHGGDSPQATWTPPVLETVATDGDGVEDVLETLGDHLDHLEATGERTRRRRSRHRDHVRSLALAEVESLVSDELLDEATLDDAADRVLARDSDPYGEVETLLAPLRGCLEPADGDGDGAEDG